MAFRGRLKLRHCFGKRTETKICMWKKWEPQKLIDEKYESENLEKICSTAGSSRKANNANCKNKKWVLHVWKLIRALLELSNKEQHECFSTWLLYTKPGVGIFFIRKNLKNFIQWRQYVLDPSNIWICLPRSAAFIRHTFIPTILTLSIIAL